MLPKRRVSGTSSSLTLDGGDLATPPTTPNSTSMRAPGMTPSPSATAVASTAPNSARSVRSTNSFRIVSTKPPKSVIPGAGTNPRAGGAGVGVMQCKVCGVKQINYSAVCPSCGARSTLQRSTSAPLQMSVQSSPTPAEKEHPSPSPPSPPKAVEQPPGSARALPSPAMSDLPRTPSSMSGVFFTGISIGQRQAPATPSVNGTDVASTARTAASVASLCNLEECVGHELPLDGDGTHVILSKADIARITDKETLAFLETMSPYFVKYFDDLRAASTVPSSPSERSALNTPMATARGATEPPSSPSPSQTSGVNGGTFMTAVDATGHKFQIALTEQEDVRIRLDLRDPSLDGAEGPGEFDDFATRLGELEDEETEREFQAAQREFLAHEQDRLVVAEDDAAEEEEEIEEIEVDEEGEEEVEEGDGTAAVDTAPTPAPTPTGKKLTVTHTGMNKAIKRIDLAVKYKAMPKDGRPRYMGQTALSDSRQRRDGMPSTTTAAEESKPSADALPHPAQSLVASAARMDDGTASAASSTSPSRRSTTTATTEAPPVRPQRRVLTDEEERRIEAMLNAVEPAAFDECIEANGGFLADAETDRRLKEIDEELFVGYSARGERRQLAPLETLIPPPKKRDAVSLGNEYLSAIRDERVVRNQMRDLEDRLQKLYGENDALSTPPFAFQQHYEPGMDPGAMQWPEAVQPLPEDRMRLLLEECVHEQNQWKMIKDSRSTEATPRTADAPPS